MTATAITSAPGTGSLATPSRRLVAAGLDLALFCLTFGVGYLIWSWFTWRQGRTPAMGLLGLRVVSRRHDSVGRRTMAVRELIGKGVALVFGAFTLGVGWLLAAAPLLLPGRRAAWDRIAGTVVVNTASGRAIGSGRRVVGRAGAALGVAAAAVVTTLVAVMWVPAAVTLVRNTVTSERADAAAGRPDAARCAALRPATRQPAQGHPDAAGTLRAFTIGYRLAVSDARDYATYRDRMRCLMEDEVVPRLVAGRPTLVVFPEDVGLPTVALGARGSTIRAQATGPLRAVNPDLPLALAGALGQFNLAYAPQIAAYQARFGGVDPRKQALLAATDTTVRAFNRTFSEIARDYGVYVVASTNTARYRVTTNRVEVALFADPEVQPASSAYVATSSRVTNSTFLWGPRTVDAAAPDFETNLLARNEKVPLTPLESDLLGLDEGPATGPAARANAAPVDVAGFPVGFATSLPAFQFGYPFGERPPVGVDPCADVRTSYAACQNALGVQVVVQADANPGRWPGPGGQGQYQPLEWMGSVWRQVADPTMGFRYNLTPMMTGNLFDLVFDGQSSISARGAAGGPRHFVGLGAPQPSDSPEFAPYAGPKPEFLAMSPWVVADDDRTRLLGVADELAGGSGAPGENAYLESVLWADLVPARR